MKISLVIDSRAIKNSGIGVYLQELLPYILRTESFQVSLLGNRQAIEEVYRGDELNKATIIECGAGIYSLREQAEFPLKVPPCDIFWSPHYNVPLLPVRAKHRVVTIHDVYHLAYMHTLKLVEKMYVRMVLPLAAVLSEKVITVSSFSKSEIVKYTGIRSEKIEVIYNGVDYLKFNDTKGVNTLNLSGRYLLYVGNVKPHKNIVGLINAFAIFHTSFPDVKLVIVGKKDNFIHGIQNLDAFIKSLGIDRHIVFTGFVESDALYSLYKNAQVFVFPSFYEGFGLPPVEAMATGVPVVASRSASIPEVCGDAAIYVDPNNPQDIAQGIIKIFRDDSFRNELIDKGYARAQCFPWQASAAKHVKLFEELYGK